MSASSSYLFCRTKQCRGTSVLEVFVACTLLSSVLAVSTPLVVRHGRLLKSQRDYRVALDELSNQLERLRALPAGELSGAVENVAPSDFTRSRLSGIALRAQVEPFDLGRRLTLFVTWNEVGRDRAPLSLTAWVVSAPQANAAASGGEESP